MALTIRVASAPPGESPSLSFDMPRLVIGRGDACDMRLPDPSVSHRHCSIRQRGAEHVLMDEGSTNGTFFGRTKLPPQSPQLLRSGDLFRVGRVWLEVRIEPGTMAQGGAAAAKELALQLVTAGLATQGEDARPLVRIVEGPDAGASLKLAERGKPYVVGRGKDTDLAVEDEGASRRHVDIELRGDQVVVRDLGSKAGARLDDGAVSTSGTTWRPGHVLSVGANRLALEHAAAEALAELERCPDERIAADEEFDPPSPPPPPSPEPAADAATPDPDAVVETPPPPRSESAPSRERAAIRTARTYGATDVLVMLVALAVLAASIAGLWLLLRGK